jgi:CubicO group peptidase (beta-lactamase class C family)
LYLQVQRMADGTLKGVLRNPELNWTGRAPWFRLVREGDHLAFIDPAGKRRLTQTYDSAQRQISFDFDGPVILRPRKADQAVGFFPRPPSAPPYEYRVPPALADGWQTARASSVGLDEVRLQELVRRIASTDPTADTSPLIHSLLVARHGRLVLDEYFTGQSIDLPHDLRSASKTFISVMAGIAMDHGARFTMSTPVTSIFPASMLTAPQDARRSRITVGQLLTHTSGMACDENNDDSPGNEDKMQSQGAEPDWYRFALNVPMANEPGRVYAYCSGGINLVGGVVARATGSWLPEFFDRYIARPLQIERYGMNLMPLGEGYSGGGMRLTSRDFLKFGQLFLSGGTWNGTRVVSADWVKRSTAQQVDSAAGGSDGLGWHRNTLKAGNRSYQEYEANGNGGQFVIVVPELDLTVVFTAGNYYRYGIWRKFRDQLVPQYLCR